MERVPFDVKENNIVRNVNDFVVTGDNRNVMDDSQAI